MVDVRPNWSLALLRIGIGFVFFWAFVDKLFGLGFATCRDAKSGIVSVMCSSAWINGGSPTFGFLKFAVRGPFAFILHNIAGNFLVDWLFMLGIFGIGIAFILGIGMRIASVTGSILLFMMWLAELWPTNNPLLDEHIIYIFAMLTCAALFAGNYLGFGKEWSKLKLVKNNPWLE